MKVALPRLLSSTSLRKATPTIASTTKGDYDSWKLSTTFLTVAGIKTAVHSAPVTESKTTLLFVHGIGGDYHGMVPLAYLLREKYRILFVDLPGHGQSAMPVNASLAILEEWSRQLPEALGSRIDMAVAHSFGCYSAQFMNIPMVSYINPPLSLSPAVLDYSFKLYSVRYLASLIYNIRPYALWRGQQLVHRIDDIVKARIMWVTDSTLASRSQFLFQARQARLTTDGRQLLQRELIDRVGSFFVISRFDKIAEVSSEYSSWIEAYPVLQLPDDHLSVIESPEVIADSIHEHIARHLL